MRFKIFSVLAAAALLSACASGSEDKVTTSGSGAGAATKPAVSVVAPAPTITPGSQEDLVANVGDRVFFGYDKYTLTDKSRTILDKQLAWLNANPSTKIIVAGHCDERGTREYNLGLGERRANAVKDYLVQLGLNPSRVRTISWGKERPVAVGSLETSWTQNRRSVTEVDTL
jgi:peptidoglycan-associated lipoprotein